MRTPRHLLLALCLASAAGAADVPGPYVFVRGAQQPWDISRLADLGVNTLYLDLGAEPYQDLASLDDRVELAREHGLGVIIAIPTSPRSFEVIPSAGGKAYRAWVEGLITRAVTHFKGNDAVVAWATGDFLARTIDYNAADLRAHLRREFGDLDAVNRWWGAAFGNWGDVNDGVAPILDVKYPFGVGRASIDIADFRRQAFHDVMIHWAQAFKAIDDTRPLMTGRISLYRDLAAVPSGFDIVCPYASPASLDPDLLTHNAHAIAMARRGGRFEALPYLDVPLSEASYGQGDLARWITVAALQGARGVGLTDWARIQESPAPHMVMRKLAETLEAASAEPTFSVRPKPSFAFLYEPYASGLMADGFPAYGHITGFSQGEPSNPFYAFRMGCRQGLADYLTLQDLPPVDLDRYGAVFCPMALRLPSHIRKQLVEYVRNGGALVCDLGAGMYETGSWIQLPDAVARLSGVGRLLNMEEAKGDLRVSWEPLWLPSIEHGARTKGSQSGKSEARLSPTVHGAPAGSRVTGSRTRTGTADQWRQHHVVGPACYAMMDGEAGAVAILKTMWHEGERVIAGIIGRETGLGVTCFATHRLWANWVVDDPTYVAFHHDLCARRPSIELLDVPFWGAGLAGVATDDGVALANAGMSAVGADVIYYGAQHALCENAFCLYSALARKPDGRRSGAVRLSVQLPPTSVVSCRRLPVLLHPFHDTCMGRVVKQTPERLVLEVGGAGAGVVRLRDGTLKIGAGEPTRIRVTIQDGVYRVKPGSRHHIAVHQSRGAASEGDITATRGGEIRFSETVAHGLVVVTPGS